MADIFISYSRKDSQHALSLAERLRSSGVTVWMDTASLAASETWSGEIVNAIKDCHTLVVLLSPNSVDSMNVTKELALASEKKKTIVPIQIAACELNSAMEYALAGLHQISLFDEVSLNRWFEKIGIRNNSQVVGIKTGGLISRPTEDDFLRLAVLPFEDLSPSHDNEWFADGMMDELINTLGSLSKLIVPGRSSVMVYKKDRPKASIIGEELEVRYIVEGTVRKAGEKIRISASLTDTNTNSQLWNNKFDGTFDDIFDFQERVAREISEGLKVKLTPQDEVKMEKKLTENPEAYELFKKAEGFSSRNTKQDLLYALKCLDEAIRIDPLFAAAYANMSIYQTQLYRNYGKDIEYLHRSAEVIKRAKELNPNLASVYYALSDLQSSRGEKREAIMSAQKALELDPKDRKCYFNLGNIYDEMSQPEIAVQYYEKVLALSPGDLNSHFNLSINYDALKDIPKRNHASERGIPFFERHLKVNPDDHARKMCYAILLEFIGRREKSAEIVEDLISAPNVDGHIIYNGAIIIIRQGNLHKAIETLENAMKKGFQIRIDRLKSDPDFDPLRGIPEFEKLLKKIESETY